MERGPEGVSLGTIVDHLHLTPPPVLTPRKAKQHQIELYILWGGGPGVTIYVGYVWSADDIGLKWFSCGLNYWLSVNY